MKKLAILVGAIALTGSTFAQKATTDAPFSLEGQLGFNASTLSFNAPAIRARYFVSDNIAVRLTFGMMKTSETFNYFETENTNTGATGTEINKAGGWGLALGGEYHFAGTDRLSPYAGLDISFGGGTSTNAWSNYDGAGYNADYKRDIEAKTSSLGVNLVAGTDYYFAENFYIGMELGIGFGSTTVKEGTDVSSDIIAGSTVTVENTSNEEKYSTLGNNFIGNFRLGWRF
jgi:outer membrane protein W